MADKKWIQKAIKNPGALHRALGIPMGEKNSNINVRESGKSWWQVRETRQTCFNVKKTT